MVFRYAFLNVLRSIKSLNEDRSIIQFTYIARFVSTYIRLTLDTIELYEEPNVLFTYILCSIAKSCMPRTTV